MYGRTCQLCGKPLSRLRAEGDFCSKEHKNQFRLRAGMSRLQEANKVASLMRRRENPRQIGAARLICNSAGAVRVCDPPKLLSAQFEAAPVWPVFSLRGNPRPPAATKAFRDTTPGQLPGRDHPRRSSSLRVRLGANKRDYALPSLPVPFTLHGELPQAPVARMQAVLPPAEPRHRAADPLLTSETPLSLGRRGAMLRSLAAPGKIPIYSVARLYPLRAAAVEGQALRVSAGVGFVVPGAGVRAHTSQPLVHSTLDWPQEPFYIVPQGIGRPAAPKSLTVAIPQGVAALPNGPGSANVVQFSPATTVPVPAFSPATGVLPAVRLCSPEWTPAGPRWSGTVPGPPAARFARNGVHLFALALQPFAIDAVRQIAEAPIQVREGPVGYPKVAIQDTLAGAILSPSSLSVVQTGLPAGMDENGMDNVVPIETVQKRFEENFDHGWDDWSAGTADWKLDAAGVRTGSLALFNPSLELTDYEFEFLARISQRTVNWVIRAASLSEYCVCTLTALPGGELAFSRAVQLNGSAEPVFTAAARIAAKPNSPVTVQTRVRGRNFSVAVNGGIIDIWTDPRLLTGGVGFTGTPEDRARLYWMRLAASDSPGKEHRTR